MSTAEPFDSLIASSGRLRILTALAAETQLEFVRLRNRTHLTDGNLCTHTRRLESAGLVAIEKSFRDRKPVTSVRLTPVGRDALERHARELLTALGRESILLPPIPASRPAIVHFERADDDWVD